MIPNLRLFIVLCVVAFLIITVFAVKGCNDEREARREAEREIAVTKRDTAAKEQAAIERANDTASIEAKHKEQVDAIESTSGDVRVAASCQRLRASGRDAADLPEQCRPAR